MIFTGPQLQRLAGDWSDWSKESVEVEYVKGTVYGFGSELAVLRLFAKYNSNGSVHVDNVRVGYSDNLNTWFFSLDT